MRRMELIVAAVLVLFSGYLMWKSTELPIGWIPEYGPGGGAFPFWISAGMLICSAAILVRAVLRITPESRLETPFIPDAGAKREVFIVTGALTAMIALTSGIYLFGVWLLPSVGLYVAVPAFMIFYMRYLGKHRWSLTLAVSLITPVVTFLFFEKLLVILLPKGITETWFYIFY